jgi:hypothetical protein
VSASKQSDWLERPSQEIVPGLNREVILVRAAYSQRIAISLVGPHPRLS